MLRSGPGCESVFRKSVIRVMLFRYDLLLRLQAGEIFGMLVSRPGDAQRLVGPARAYYLLSGLTVQVNIFPAKVIIETV